MRMGMSFAERGNGNGRTWEYVEWWQNTESALISSRDMDERVNVHQIDTKG
jgi:hypothetical protein